MNPQLIKGLAMWQLLKPKAKKAAELLQSLGEGAFVQRWKETEGKKNRAIMAAAYLATIYYRGDVPALLEESSLGIGIKDLANYFGIDLKPEGDENVRSLDH